MNKKVYLALYKAKGNWQDRIIRLFTKGKYSHCELVVEELVEWGQYDWREEYTFYSSSPRDGGVRCKQMDLNRNTWDLIELPHAKVEEITAFFNRTSGQKYDWWGVLGIILGIKHKRSRYFCSEWCWEALGNLEGWRFSPSDLAVIFKQNKENDKER